MTRKPVFLVLHGPSGVGKDSVIEVLRRRTGIHRAMSSTSRARRTDETGEGHYHFLSRLEFEEKIAADHFIEHADVYGDWKGLERAEVLPYIDRGDDVVIRTDVQGARTWRVRVPAAVTVFLMAENPATLRQRLTRRKTEDGDSLERRLAELEAELADIPLNDYLVLNRHGAIEEAAAEIDLIIERERSNFLRLRPFFVE
jgi:guanylate kinase